jgi:hypothetical protein
VYGFRLGRQTPLQAVFQFRRESAAIPGIAAGVQAESQRGHEDRTEEEGVLGGQGVRVSVPLIIDPGGVREHGLVVVLDDQTLELTVLLKRRKQVAFPAGIRSEHHVGAFAGGDGALIDHLREHRVGMVEEFFEPGLAVIGQAIVYSSGAEVYIAGRDGTNPRKLVTTPGFASAFRWSPSGGTLRFSVSDRATSLDSLWETSANGAGLRPVLPDWKKPPNESSGEWTADGKY